MVGKMIFKKDPNLKEVAKLIISRVENYKRTEDTSYLDPDVMYISVSNSLKLQGIDFRRDWIYLEIEEGVLPHRIGFWYNVVDKQKVGVYYKNQH